MNIYEMSADAAGRAVDILNHYPGPIMIACAIVGSGIVAYTVTRWMESRKPKDGEAMARREAQLDSLFADKFGDAMFDALMKGEISRQEYKTRCRKYGIAYRLSDLLVKNNHIRAIKSRVHKNCEEIHRSPPPKLVGPKPGEGLPVVVMAKQHTRKVWIVQGSVKLNRKSA